MVAITNLGLPSTKLPTYLWSHNGLLSQLNDWNRNPLFRITSVWMISESKLAQNTKLYNDKWLIRFTKWHKQIHQRIDSLSDLQNYITLKNITENYISQCIDAGLLIHYEIIWCIIYMISYIISYFASDNEQLRDVWWPLMKSFHHIVFIQIMITICYMEAVHYLMSQICIWHAVSSPFTYIRN